MNEFPKERPPAAQRGADSTSEGEDSADLIGADAEADSPGRRLRAERLRRALGEDEVADQLHITRHYLRAIEEDAYDRLPGEVFARGYVRNYCLLLEMPTEPTMTLFEGLLTIARLEKAARGTPKRTLTRADRNQRWLGLSLLVSIGLFALLWFFNG